MSKYFEETYFGRLVVIKQGIEDRQDYGGHKGVVVDFDDDTEVYMLRIGFEEKHDCWFAIDEFNFVEDNQ